MEHYKKVARLTGLEPATSGVTGRHSNQLSYNRPLRARVAPNVGTVYDHDPAPSSGVLQDLHTSQTPDALF